VKAQEDCLIKRGEAVDYNECRAIGPEQLECTEGEDFSSGREFLLPGFFSSKRPSLTIPEMGWRPQTDLFETEDEIVVIAEVAGISSKDLSVVLDNDILIIRGIRREERGLSKRHYHEMEIEYGPFERILKLPSPVDQSSVLASYRNGFLEIIMKKSDRPVERLEIKIK
jgi:HSP20 family protein